VSVNGLYRKCRDKRGASQRDEFDQHGVVSNIEPPQNDLSVDQHIELARAGFSG
jgi:hypothetical protein